MKEEEDDAEEEGITNIYEDNKLNSADNNNRGHVSFEIIENEKS